VVTEKPLYWHEGLFLGQQHMQWNDAYHAAAVWTATRSGPHGWGVRCLSLSDAAIRNMVVQIDTAELVFRDGTRVAYPGNAVGATRSFNGTWNRDSGPLRVYVGIRRLRSDGGNVGRIESATAFDGTDTRYVVLGDDDISDIYGDGKTVSAQRLTLVLRILWEAELASFPDYECIPLAEITIVNGVPAISPDYVPPLVELGASPHLIRYVASIGNEVEGRVRMMEDYRNRRQLNSIDFERNTLLDLAVLITLNRAVTGLRHYREESYLHPVHVYGFLRQLAGELLVFSSRLGANGLEESILTAPYDHEMLGERFIALCDLIVSLLNEISLGSDRLAKFEGDGKLFRAVLAADFFGSRRRYYLVVRLDGDETSLRERVTVGAKLAAPARVEILASRALPGVPLALLSEAPHGMPRHGNVFYFRIDGDSDEWTAIEQAGAACLFLADFTSRSAFEIAALGE